MRTKTETGKKDVGRVAARGWASMLALLLAAASFLAPGLEAQDFGFGDFSGGSGGGGLTVEIAGKLGLTLTSRFKDYRDGMDKNGNPLSLVRQPDALYANLDFSTSSSLGDAVVKLRLNPAGFVTADDVAALDEAYLRVFFGSFELEAGRRRLNWGKADAGGPLNVINTSGTSGGGSDGGGNSSGNDMGSLANASEANTLLHGTYRFGQSKVEAVFVPVYEPSSQIAAALSDGGMMSTLTTGITDPYIKTYADQALAAKMIPDTTTLEYFQTGVRFSTILGPVDLGAQYYYGRKAYPAIDFDAVAKAAMAVAVLGAAPTTAAVDAVVGGISSPLVYNPYHQIGVDAAWGLLGCNFRAELAANISSDFDGDDPAVYNPNLAWHLGFDREIFWDMTLIVMANETITLLHDKIDSTAYPMDADHLMGTGSDVSATSLIALVSKNFFDGDLGVSLAGMATVEKFGFAVMPSVTWKQGNCSISLSAGFFGGNDDSQFGQNGESLNFASVALTYSF
ncbi:MAG: hypothetical protein LBU00_06685 [Treponema sp.]|jgi:hypothetical protein|nr:hypothetical protein [Treponema sp.]